VNFWIEVYDEDDWFINDEGELEEDYEEYEDGCPNLIAFLKDNKIDKCLLHFWW